MGSGFNFFTNAIDKTPGTMGSWQDVDCSSDIPSGSTGVIVKIVDTNTSIGYRGEVRKNGSTNDFSLNISPYYCRYAFVGVDSNRIFEAYIGSTDVKIYLIGYADENCGFFDNAIDKTPGTTGSWLDVDVSSDIPSGATGVICLLYTNNTTGNRNGGIRNNGSTDTFSYGRIASNKKFVYQLCGVDANRLFEAKIDNTELKVMLVGYTKAPVTFFTNGIDKSLSVTSTWTDIDVTSDTEATADGAILFIKNTATSAVYKGDARKNGSTDNHTSNTRLDFTECRSAAIGMDSSQIFEGWIDNINVDFYLIGYCKPAGIEIYVNAIINALANHSEQAVFNVIKNAAASSNANRASEAIFKISRDILVQTLDSIIIEVVSGIIEIFKDAIVTAQVSVNNQTIFNLAKDAMVNALAKPQILSIYPINVDAVAENDALVAIMQTLNINKNAQILTVSTPLTQFTFTISPEAVAKVIAEVEAAKAGEVKVTKLFLVLGSIAIQLTV